MPILIDKVHHFYSNTDLRTTHPRSPGHRRCLPYGSVHSYAVIWPNS